MTIDDFYEDFKQDVLAKAGADANFLASAFLEHVGERLLEAEGYPALKLVSYKHTRKGLAVDAYAEDDEGRLYLFFADFRNVQKVENLTASELRNGFAKLERFIDACGQHDFIEALEDSAEVVPLARNIAETHGRKRTINLVFVSDAQLSTRVDIDLESHTANFKVSREIWDLQRIYQLETSGEEREPIEVDFISYEKNGIPCLRMPAPEDGIQAYLMILPGVLLADLYAKYGERLFEQNVRTFLQFRGKVNNGIRKTILFEPKMFFSYNNGISATAESVETSKQGDRLHRAKNLQIVNGGQTTASIFTAFHKEKAALNNIFVQVKLTLVNSDKAEAGQVSTIISKISEYANTQNKIAAADFFSNHPFQLRVESLSRSIWAPAADGGMRQTRWFYERARGQFNNAKANLTKAKEKEFLLQHPKEQMFTKTDLAKILLSFEGRPHYVSLGAQKAFANGFVMPVKKKWDEDQNQFHDFWFKESIAKSICFREIDRAIRRDPFFDPYRNYKANIIAYTLARFSILVDFLGKSVDYELIWKRQKLPDALAAELLRLAKVVTERLMKPPEGATNNISEWAKREKCWDSIRDVPFTCSDSIDVFLIDAAEYRRKHEKAKDDYLQTSGLEARQTVVDKGAAYWEGLFRWGEERGDYFNKHETVALKLAVDMPRRFPSHKQCKLLLDAEEHVKRDGFGVEGED
jgi:hypothetical protein